MEPRIQYARTADGVSIAFSTLGEGEPLVYMPLLPLSHVQAEWEMPESRGWLERLAGKRRLVRYDSRGWGLSGREVSDFSLDALLLDLEAIVDRLSLRRFALLGGVHVGPVAIAYAVRHPEHISRLILWCTYARGSDFSRSSDTQSTRALIDRDWATYCETLARVALGWSAGEQAGRLAAFLRESTTPEATLALIRGASAFDVTSLLSNVASPTLVVHHRQYRWVNVDVAGRLASQVGDARLVLVEGTSGVPFLEGTETLLGAIDEFLGEEEDVAVPVPASTGLVTILFTDIESSTALRRRLGDARAQDLLRTHNTIVREALRAHAGSEIKHTGDGIMASFSTASGALECAIAIQKGIAAHVEQHPDAPLAVYVGLNAGEPIAEEEDLFGTSVDLARRICDNAQPGQILVSDLVAGLAAGKGFVFEDQGEASLKGFERPVRLFEVRWQESV